MTKSRTASIQSEAAAGGDNSPFLDDMASNIRPLRRRLRLTKGRLVGRMTQERQKLSFFIVIMFLVIFGLIVLAEVLFMEDGKPPNPYYPTLTENYRT